MSTSTITIYCPGSKASQTGTAVGIRYPGVQIADCGKIPDVIPLLDQNAGPYVIPIWNSHQGEIKSAEYVWNQVQEARIKITDIWPKAIQFWFVRRKKIEPLVGKIGSVTVAKTQCSIFLAKRGFELVEKELTTIAFEEYKRGEDWDGVLVADGQGEGDVAYEILDKETANPNNFTSFVTFVPTRAYEGKREDGGSWLTAVTMKAFGVALGDDEQSFFHEMLSVVKSINEAPKPIFVLKRTAKVGLLFEGPLLHTEDLLDSEEIQASDIAITENAGLIARPYGEELQVLFEQLFPDMISGDFVLNRGKSTCLFSCPPLGLYTHGYEVQTVEPVIRFYIHRLFQLWEEGAECTEEQEKFFWRHKDAWEEQGSKFMNFLEIKSS